MVVCSLAPRSALAPAIGHGHTHPRPEARTARSRNCQRLTAGTPCAALLAGSPSLVTLTRLTCPGLRSGQGNFFLLPRSSLTGIARRPAGAPTRGPLLPSVLPDSSPRRPWHSAALQQLRAESNDKTTRAPTRGGLRGGRRKQPPPRPRAPWPGSGRRHRAGPGPGGRGPPSPASPRTLSPPFPPGPLSPPSPRGGARLTRRRAARAPPGRPARSGRGRPSACGPPRGLPLPGGASRLRGERRRSGRDARLLPGPREAGGRRVRSPPARAAQPRRPPPPPRRCHLRPRSPPAGAGAAAAGGGAAAPAPGPAGEPLAPLGEGARPGPGGGGGGGGRSGARGKARGLAATPAAGAAPREQAARPGTEDRRGKVGRALFSLPPGAPTFCSEGGRSSLPPSPLPWAVRLQLGAPAGT